MQIHSLSSGEDAAPENSISACPLRCPLCSEALVPLHNSYRCSRCSYHLCASCEAIEPEALKTY